MQSTGTCGPNAYKIWLYEWNAAGHLSREVRPDGQSVDFAYDALGRRVAKTFAGRTTRWVWDGNLPLHEWQEETGIILDVEPPPAYEMDARLAEVLQLLRDKTLSPLSPQGPPQRANAEQPITWLFEPDSFAPLARLQGERRESIVCDHLGTPLAMSNDAGDQTWSLDLDIYGQPRMVEGERTLCPFRYPGQYEDSETGLYYNRFRYFDPEAGGYISQDPIRLEGENPTLYGYVEDPNDYLDPFGLSKRTDYLGKTPGKSSRTGRQVIERMRSEGTVRGKGSKTEFFDKKKKSGSPFPKRTWVTNTMQFNIGTKQAESTAPNPSLFANGCWIPITMNFNITTQIDLAGQNLKIAIAILRKRKSHVPGRNFHNQRG